MIITSGPPLSIITVNWNNREGLRRTLESIHMQAADPSWFEVIVVDAGSADGSQQVVRSFEDKIPLTWVSEPDHGIYHGMNKGLTRASGDYVQYLNSGDAFARADALALVLDAMASNRKALWIVSAAIHLHAGVLKPTVLKAGPHRWLQHAYGIAPRCHQACWFRRDLLVQINGVSTEFGLAGDFDLILRVGILGPPSYVNVPLVEYEGGGLSSSNNHTQARSLHEVRRTRLSLTGWARTLDAWFTVVYQKWAHVRIFVGSHRRPRGNRLVRVGVASMHDWTRCMSLRIGKAPLFRWQGGLQMVLAEMLGKIPMHAVRLIGLRALGVTLGKGVVVYRGLRLRRPSRVVIGNTTVIGDGALLDGREGIRIGSNVNISSEVSIWTLQHDLMDEHFGTKGGPVQVDDYAWLSFRCTILPSVHIGRGAVVAAGAVVTKDVAAYAVVAGVPAKQIGVRNHELSYRLGGHAPFL